MTTSLAERPRVAAASLLLVLASVEFWFRAPVLTGAFALYQRDLFLLYFPLVQSALRGLSEGALPLRDASSAFGQPLLADPSCQILYPPVALHLLLPPHQAYAWFVSLHSVFGAFGVGLLARRLSGGSWLAALVASLAWLASGPLQSLATLWHHMAGAAWIPWVVLAVLRVRDGTHRYATATLGAAFGAQILAGSADMCAMTGLLSVLFVAPRDYLRFWKTWAAGLFVALALGSGMWLPASELVQNSARSALPESVRTYWSVHPLSALELFLPLPLIALPLLPEWRIALFEGREAFLGSLFMGTVLLPLALAGVFDPTTSRASRFACFAGAIGGFLAALGKHAAAYGWLVALIPPLAILRFPSKAMIPVTVCVCVLAGLGAAAIRRSARARKVAGVTALISLVGALLFAGPGLPLFAEAFLDGQNARQLEDLSRYLPFQILTAAGILGLFIACLVRPYGKAGGLFAALVLLGHLAVSYQTHQGFNATVPSAVLSYRPEHLELLRPPPHGRIYVYDYGLFQGRAMKYLGGQAEASSAGLEELGPDAARVVSSRAYLTPLTGAFWGIDYAWDADLRLLFDRRLAALTTGVRRVEGTPGLLRLLQISGVTRVASLHEKDLEDLRLLSRTAVYHREDLRIFEVPDPLPRAFVTSGRVIGGGSDLRDLMSFTFDPRHSVLVDSGPGRSPAENFKARAHIREIRPDRVLIETDSNAPAFLTVLEGYLPGWRARVDGRPSKVERANGIFVGTEIPAGRHMVEFRFLPATAVVGVSLTAITALGLLYAFVTSLRFRPAG